MSSKKYILALDQGTGSSRAILFDKQQQIKSIDQTETTRIYPKPGWVEQNPEEIWETQKTVVDKVLSDPGVRACEIAAIGVTNQRESVIVWDKNTGKPVYNAIIWQDQRTVDFCNMLKAQNRENFVRKKTGLVIDTYFSATKINWILKNVKGAYEKAKNGDLLFGTVDTWLIWKLTNGKQHITDYTNASRTLLFNIHELKWDNQLLALFDIPACILPGVKASSGYFGTTTLWQNTEIPISGIAGDQQAALFGQLCHEKGMVKNTYGTGCFMLMNTGNKPVKSEHGQLTTIAYSVEKEIMYALEGSVFVAGAVVKWLRDSLQVIENTAESEAIALSITGSEGVYVVPAFSGIGAPYWDMTARGAIIGLTQHSNKRHITRAALEAIAFQSKDVIEAMQKDTQTTITSLNVDGGASANNFLMQFQSDILNVKVNRPKNIESTALGAAMLAALAVDFWNKEDLTRYRTTERCFSPVMKADKREKLYTGWENAVQRVIIRL